MKYDNIDPEVFNEDMIELKTSGNVSLYDAKKDAVIFSGPYEKVRFLGPDRYAVMEKNKWDVRNKNHDIIVNPLSGGRYVSPFRYETNSTVPIIAYRFDEKYQLFDNEGRSMTEQVEIPSGPCEYLYTYWGPCLSQAAVNSATKEVSHLLNSADAWITLVYENDKSIGRQLVNSKGEVLTDLYPYIERPRNTNLFLLRTKQEKYGVLRITPDP